MCRSSSPQTVCANIIPFQGIQASRTFSWAEAERFREPTMVERVYARLKGEFGGRDIRVRGNRIEQLDESGTLFPPPDRI